MVGDLVCIERHLLITLSMLPMLQGALITPLLAVTWESASDGRDSTLGFAAAACMLVALAAFSASSIPRR